MIIEVESVSLYYDSIEALNDVSLRLEPGKITCVLGPNGAGKTSLLKVIAAILWPSQGAVYIDGKDYRLYNAKELAKMVAYEEPFISRSLPMTVLDFILTARYPHQNGLRYLESDEDLKVVEDLAKELNIAHLLSRKLDSVSSGELQRVIIAHALAKKPRAILLDEPSAFLDIKYRFDIMEQVKKYTIKENLVTVVALHDLHLASMYCDTIILLNNGSVVACGKPSDVLTSSVIEETYGIGIRVIELDHGQVAIIPLPKTRKE
uniref:ABC transporter ATP-binding protein n=1 Tax=Ignisphaera aggregans TaxID=334771 RepID=A0A7C2Z8T7_9CREN